MADVKFPWAKEHGKHTYARRTFAENIQYTAENIVGMAPKLEESAAHRVAVRDAIHKIGLFLDAHEKNLEPIQATNISKETGQVWVPKWKGKPE